MSGKMLIAKVERGSDSIGWDGTLMHDHSAGCIHPPPFGKQCTMLRANAVATCLLMAGCTALTCPDPSESHIGRKLGVTGPVCQARSSQVAKEKNHGMCRPGGCMNIAFKVHHSHGNHASSWTDAVNSSVPVSAAASVSIVRFRPSSGVSAETLPALVDQLLLPGASWKLALRNGPPGARHDLPFAVLPRAAAVPTHVSAVELRA